MTEIDQTQILGSFRAQTAAMVAGDTTALAELLPASFTLTHITGYVQPLAEWLDQMRAGQFDYAGVEEKDVAVHVEEDRATLTGRIVTDATVYGTRASWRLALTQEYRRLDGTWTPQHSVATTW